MKKCNEQLTNENVHEKCNELAAVQLNNKIQGTLSSMLSKKEIDKKVMNYLIKKEPHLGRFYLLPKIHTQKRIQSLRETNYSRCWNGN